MSKAEERIRVQGKLGPLYNVRLCDWPWTREKSEGQACSLIGTLLGSQTVATVRARYSGPKAPHLVQGGRLWQFGSPAASPWRLETWDAGRVVAGGRP